MVKPMENVEDQHVEDKIIFNPSAFKHEFSKEDVFKAIESKIYEGPVKGFENKYAIIGFNSKGALLEILYNIIDSESINLFHVDKCKPNFRKQLMEMRSKDKWQK